MLRNKGLFLATLALAIGSSGCEPSGLPDPDSSRYAETVSAFYRGVAAAQVGESGVAEASFRRVTELAPLEPAGWADLGLVALQRRELEQAASLLAEARSLAPEDSRIRLISALVERERGRTDSATAQLRRAVELDPRHLRALYLLAEVVGSGDQPEDAAEAQQVIERVLAVVPGNLVALLERARLAAKVRDSTALRQTLDRIETRTAGLGSSPARELRAVRAAAATGDYGRAATQIAFLQTELQPLAAFRDDQEAVRLSPSRGEVLLTAFVRLPTPTTRASRPDTALTFVPETLLIAGAREAEWVHTLWLSDEVPLALLAAGADTVWLSPDPDYSEAFVFPRAAGPPPAPAAVAPIDYNYDFRTDLVVAGAGGLRLLRQDEAGSFHDATTEALPPSLVRSAYTGAWVADIDMEGDVDIVLSRLDGSPMVLWNRGDGKFESGTVFAGVTRLSDFVWADLDGDGDPDAALLDAGGRLQIFRNGRERVGQFERLPLPNTLGSVHAIAGADLNSDATLDLVLLGADGIVRRLSLVDGSWRDTVLVQWVGYSAQEMMSTRLLLADLDNNGSLDLVASTPEGTRVWIAGAQAFVALPLINVPVTSIADISGDGRLDLIGVSAREPRLLTNQGTMDYYSTSIHPRAAEATGDRRINSFGIGGEVEIRASLLYQKRLIDGPRIHFGLGEQPQVDVARILWPNGTAQVEFNLAATNETILTRQRLKGSCPWVFTFDGAGMQFITDFLWRSALGLRINAQGHAAVIHSEDWIKIRGDQLVPRDGFYDVRITAELWETHFFDHVALLAVDHPAGTEVFVDERFRIPAPVPGVRTTEMLRPIAWARDHKGRDVTALLRERDERYVDTFDLGLYQGLARDHHVELALGTGVPAEGPLLLIAHGWVYPTDASINVAISQGSHGRPRGLALEVPDGHGGWTVVDPDLGFPAGKSKTIMIDLTHAFQPGAERIVRLRTNMEVYWDQIAWTTELPDAPTKVQRILPATAELRYRGFSEVGQTPRRSPELPEYERLGTGVPQWRDLVGFHTRFGDIRPLNEKVDDRYTIMNAGDELAFQFRALPPPDSGWVRDFVLIGDGWVKDGDYNTGFSTTVLPLPYHGMSDYARPPERLEDDPAFRLHPEDWEVFHTRYVTPRVFHRALTPDPND